MIEGIILAGGLSSRMGRDKALLPYGGVALIEHMKNLLVQSGIGSIRISGEGAGGVPDALPRSGPVGGICTMIAGGAAAEGWLFVPVDMPLLRPALLQRLMPEDVEAVHFNHTPLPLFLRNTARMRERAAEVAAQLRAGGDFSILGFLQPLDVASLPVSDAEQAQLANINTPDEWRELLEASR